jgi:hypothetical protein
MNSFKWLLLCACALVSACGQQESLQSNSMGQVQPVSGVAKVSYYAASRFAEQAAQAAAAASQPLRASPHLRSSG